MHKKKNEGAQIKKREKNGAKMELKRDGI